MTDSASGGNRNTKPQQSLLRAKLSAWAAQPLRVANSRTIVGTWLAMVFVLLVSHGEPGPTARVALARNAAMISIGLHGFLHVWLTGWLSRESAVGVTEAKAALNAYRNPKRISHIDLAIAWVVFTTLVSMFNSHPLTSNTGG